MSPSSLQMVGLLRNDTLQYGVKERLVVTACILHEESIRAIISQDVHRFIFYSQKTQYTSLFKQKHG